MQLTMTSSIVLLAVLEAERYSGVQSSKGNGLPALSGAASACPACP